MAKTLQNLRDQLRDRLGFAEMASSSGPTQLVLDSFLQGAQSQLYWQYEWEHLRRIWDIPTVIATNQYAYPANADSESPEPRRILSVHAVDDAGRWVRLREGIDPALYSNTATAIPQRFARIGDKLEVWPVPDAVYTIKVEGFKALDAFSAASDTVTIDAELVFLLALANAKAHYGQADHQLYFNQVGTMLGQLRAANHGTGRYIPGRDVGNTPAMPKMA
ncbi:MAG TPA: hypothetical protein VFP95_02465 [Gammaproteobacteria bacterium]|nr:hypothetical protein [Gammaproteobacteria bacterium]